jgi:uncharacterized protein
MRLFLAGILLVLFACSDGPRPAPSTSMVFDEEHVLDTAEHAQLDQLFIAHARRTRNQIALVTHPTFNGKRPVDFAVDFGDSLGVGQSDLDNGVVIAFSKARRAVFIATGHGTERVLHDSICKRIVDQEMIPRFKDNDAFGGLLAGSKAVVEFLERPENRIE